MDDLFRGRGMSGHAGAESRDSTILQVVPSDISLPDEVDIAIVGGGIIGITSALFLAEKGFRVSVFEKGQVACEQSSRNWGWVRQMGRDPVEVPLCIESLKLWSSFKQRYHVDTGFRQTGITFLCRTGAEISKAESWASTGAHYQLPQQILDRNQIMRMLGGAGPGFVHGLHTESDGRAEPAIAAPMLAGAARRAGARLFTDCAARGIEFAAGRASAVVTERGRVRCGAVVVAAGAWSRLFLGSLGVRFPALAIIATAGRISAVPDVPDMPVGGGDFAFRRRLDGGFTIACRNRNTAPVVPDSFRSAREFWPLLKKSWRGLRFEFGREFAREMSIPRQWPLDGVSPFETCRVLDPSPHHDFNARAVQALRQAFPAFRNGELTHEWAGKIDVMPDEIPVIDQVGNLPGVHVASGFSGHGFGIGPGAGQLMAELVAGERPCVDPTPFRLSRFTSRDPGG